MADISYETRIIKVSASQPADDLLRPAALALSQGELVAFPTETVYGLGANALDAAAVGRIFAVKGRPADNPLIVHAASLAELEPYVTAFPPLALCLFQHFAPGPLTLVLPKAKVVPDLVTGGLDTVAVRIPAHPVALALLRLAGVAVAAPSANSSGKPSPTQAWHVAQDLAGKIPYLIDGGPCQHGLESTVLDLCAEKPRILRPGSITAAQIESVCDIRPEISSPSQGPLRSPGMKYRHYAPRARVVLADESAGRSPAALIEHFRADKLRLGLYCSRQKAAAVLDLCQPLTELAGTLAPGGCLYYAYAELPDPALAGKHLFDALRSFDTAGCDIIIIESLPETGVGLAYMNRVKKAAQPEL